MTFKRNSNPIVSMSLGLNSKLKKLDGVLLSEKDFKYVTPSIRSVIAGEYSKNKLKMSEKEYRTYSNIVVIIGKKYKIIESSMRGYFNKSGDLSNLNNCLDEMIKMNEDHDDEFWEYTANYLEEYYEESKPDPTPRKYSSSNENYFKGQGNHKSSKSYNRMRRR